LARALRLPVEFFSGPDPVEIPPAAISFRALTRTTARQRDQAQSSAAVAFDVAAWITERFELPPPDVPQYPGIDPETAAAAVRSAWGLGERRISNMVHLLESRGVLVFSLIEECHEIDAFSVWRNSVPYVFFNTTKSSEHGRFDAAHELGHLVLHHDPVTCLHDRSAERDAQRFASAFLMPERSVLAKAPRHGHIADLIRAKHHWGVSLSALTYRMHTLSLLTDWQYRSLFKRMGALGYITNEPETDPRETSQVLAKVLAVLRARNLSSADIAQDIHVSPDLVHKLFFGLTMTPVEGSGSPQPRQTTPPRLRLV
jgi:Zn-dependent peptidase ImmA (M78 family)